MCIRDRNLTGKMEDKRVVPGVMVIVVGILYFFQAYFKLEEKSLVTYSLLGFVAWRYSIDHISDLSFDGSKLFRNKDGKTKRIRISRFACDKIQWQEFVRLIEKVNLAMNYIINYLATGISLIVTSEFSQTPDSKYSS